MMNDLEERAAERLLAELRAEARALMDVVVALAEDDAA